MGYFESLDSDLVLEPTPVGVSFSTLEYSHDSFIENIKNHVFSPTKIQNIIESNVSLYFNYAGFTDPKSRQHMQAIWSNIDFLDNVRILLKENQKFYQKVVSAYKRDINIIARDYLTANDAIVEKDSKVSELLFEIVSLLDAEQIVMLSSKIPMGIAKGLCIAYYGIHELSNSKRSIISYIWATVGVEVLSIEQIIYIFYVFYKDSFADLFCGAMCYTWDMKENDDIKQVDDNISSALINILNSMSTTEIRSVLAKYSNYLSYYLSYLGDQTKKVRFSLKHLPAEFKNVAECVKEAESLNYYIP